MAWKGWHGSSMSAVEELPIRTRVLALPRGKADLGWCPVITLGEGGHARFTYIHPQVIKPLVSQKEVRIGHVMWRGRDPPTHDLGWANPGVRAMGGRVVLDARWSGYGDGKRRGGKSCSGYCPFFWSSIARNPELMGFILQFAAREGDIVCCNYGAHRSVATANILQIAFARRVNWKHASPFRCCSFCVRPEEWSIPDLLWDAFSWITPSSESMPTVSVQIGIAWVSASVRRILSPQFRVLGFKHIGKRPGAALRQPCPRLCLGSLSPARHVSSEGNSGIGRLAGTLARHRTAPPMPQASSQGLLKFAAKGHFHSASIPGLR